MTGYTAHYCADTDMTFITMDSYNGQGDPLKTQVIGFYFGEPDDNTTAQTIKDSAVNPASALTACFDC